MVDNTDVYEGKPLESPKRQFEPSGDIPICYPALPFIEPGPVLWFEKNGNAKICSKIICERNSLRPDFFPIKPLELLCKSRRLVIAHKNVLQTLH